MTCSSVHPVHHISAGGLTTSHGHRTLTIPSTFVRKTMTIMIVSSSQTVAGKLKKISVKTVECHLSAKHRVKYDVICLVPSDNIPVGPLCSV